MGKESLKVIIGSARNISSSRSVYCEVRVLDKDGQTMGPEVKTFCCKGTTSPTWNTTLSLGTGDGFAGIAVRLFEKHKVFTDKFLGIVRLKFNTQKLLSGEDELDTWFSLSNIGHKKGGVTGEIHIKVTYSDGRKRSKSVKKPSISTSSPAPERPKRPPPPSTPSPRKTPVVDADIVTSSDSSSDVEPDHQPLKASGNWTDPRKNNALLQSAFVVIDEDSPSSTATAGDASVDLKTSSSKKGGEEKGDGKNVKFAASSNKGKEKANRQLKREAQSRRMNKLGIPTDVKGQIALIEKMIKETKGSVVTNFEADESNNLSFEVINRQKEKSSEVTLMVPSSIERGEFILWTMDGALELGRVGSILGAMNKVVESFARKNKLTALPVFPEGTKNDRNRKAQLLASGWANLDKVDKDDDEIEYDDEDIYYSDDDDLPGDSKDNVSPAVAQSSKKQLMKFVDEFVSLHGKSELGMCAGKAGIILRLALLPKNFLEPLLARVWQVDINKRIIIELSIVAPYFLGDDRPPRVRFFQTNSTDLNKTTISETSFGLQWYLAKRIEKFLFKNWPPTHKHLFLDLMGFTIAKIMNCTENCMICDSKLPFSLLKPTICDKEICLFSQEQYGLGVDPAAEIASSFERVDLLISFTKACALLSDPRRFTPFPSHIEVKWRGPNGNEITKRFQQNPTGQPTKADLTQISQIIDRFPNLVQLKNCATSKEIKRLMDSNDRMGYPLLRWILTSNRAHLAKLRPNETIKQVSTEHQYLLLSSPPAKERKFQLEKRKHGSFWAFHGSAFGNWHSIMRNGLKNLSGTALMSTGQIYGAGIYLAADSNTSMGYARSGAGWSKSLLNQGSNTGIQVLALCEVVAAGYKANPYYVVANEDHIVTRYLFVFNSKNAHRSTPAASCVFPKTEYLKYQKAF